MTDGPRKVTVWDIDFKYIGNGTYEHVSADELPEHIKSEMRFAEAFGHPKITLDNGSVLYGCECWFSFHDDVGGSSRMGTRQPAIPKIKEEEKGTSGRISIEELKTRVGK